GITTVTMANFQWHDADGFTWTYDAANRSASFWKEIPIKESERGKKPPFDEAAVMKAADAFMDAHGFSEIRKKGGVIQDIPQFHPLMKGGGTDSSMPCITNDAVRPEVGSPRLGLAPSGVGTASPGIAPPAGAPDGDSGKIRAEPETAIYPSPCWWPIQATVSYPGEREGRKLADSYGNDVNVSNIAIDLQTGQVANGFVQLDENAERSSYPLIDRETAKRRLQSGGRNPVWPWGNETGNIEVHLKTIELVWMRYDVWNNGTNDTYYLPAIRGLGTVLRGKGMEPEEYRTIIPLLADDVFEDVTPPGPEPLPLGGDAQMLQAPGKR
ncbi:MAG TPA: hypothetical protein VN397_04055, partial [Candidatus Methylomirabilis sp.]|nr:hypothetical protein [Candidatus Methylomirabilis sp.]